MIDKKIQLTFNSTVNKRVKVRSNCELYSHDKNNNEFELTINNYTLTNEEITVLFKFVKSVKYWETQGKIEDNKIKFKFDTSLITDNERVNCYIILKNEEKESDVYSFSFDVKMSEYDLKDNLPVKERYFANGVVVDKLDVLTKEVLAAELEKAKTTFALKTDLSDVVRTSDISDVVRTSTLNDYQLKSEMPNVVEIVNNTVDSKGFLTTHQSLVDYAKKSELPIDYVSNSKLEELKTQLTIDTSNFATRKAVEDVEAKVTQLENRPVTSSYDDTEIKRKLKELEDRPTTANIDTRDFATKRELEEVSNRQPIVDFSNLVTKSKWEEKYSKQDEALNTISSKVYEIERKPILHFNENNLVTKTELESKGYLTQHQPLTDYATEEELRKAFLDEENQEKYAKKTELPQPYNDTDIKNRLTTLENKPSENVDTSNFTTKSEAPYVATGNLPLVGYFSQNSTTRNTSNFGKLYSDNYGNHLVVSGRDKTAKFESLLYTVASSLPDYYEPDFDFSERENIKFITTRNIHDYIPANTGNAENTTELDKRLKVLEANTGNTTELDKRLKVLEANTGNTGNTGNTTELDNRLKVLEAKNWEIHGRGMPNGTVTAPVGTTYVDEAVTNGALKWIKKSGTGNVGWDVLIGDTGWKVLPAVSKLGNSFVKVRRVNNVVSYQFGGLSWGWFGIVRRGGAGYQVQPSDRERNVFILGLQGIPQGYRSESSLIGGIYNDKGVPYGTWYLGGAGDSNMLRFQFTDSVPTDRDIGDIRVSSISYLTSDPWPTN